MIEDKLKKILFVYAADIIRLNKTNSLNIGADQTRAIAIKQIKSLFDTQANSVEEIVARLQVKYGK